MKWSEEQRKAHEEMYERFSQDLVEGRRKTASIEQIKGDKNKCFPLVSRVDLHRDIRDGIAKVHGELRELQGFYFQDIPHFTIDCHRYRKSDELPEGFDEASLETQPLLLISEDELTIYGRVLTEEIVQEPPYEIEINGVSIGTDGLVARVWYDDQRMIDFTQRLGEIVRREVPGMDFIWERIKIRDPTRTIVLTRFTGEEDTQEVLKYVDANRERGLGGFVMRSIDLLFADHYLQKGKTQLIERYDFGP